MTGVLPNDFDFRDYHVAFPSQKLLTAFKKQRQSGPLGEELPVKFSKKKLYNDHSTGQITF